MSSWVWLSSLVLWGLLVSNGRLDDVRSELVWQSMDRPAYVRGGFVYDDRLEFERLNGVALFVFLKWKNLIENNYTPSKILMFDQAPN